MKNSKTWRKKLFSVFLLSIFFTQTFIQPVYAIISTPIMIPMNPYLAFFPLLPSLDESISNLERNDEENLTKENNEEKDLIEKHIVETPQKNVESKDFLESTLFITSTDTYGYIGNHPSKGADEPSDNIFSFTINKKNTSGKQLYLVADIKGIANASGLALSINEELSSGGYYISKSDEWNTIEIPLSGNSLKEGINHIMFTLPNGSNISYEVKNPKIKGVDVSNDKINYSLMDGHHLYLKDGKAYIKGYVDNPSIEVFVDDVKASKDGNYFEVFVPANDQTKFINLRFDNGVQTYEYNHMVKHISLINTTISKRSKEKKIAIEKINEEDYWQINTSDINFKIHPNDYSKVSDITVTKLRSIDVAPLGQSIINVTANASAYRFLPDGAKFENELGLTLSFDKEKLPKGYSEKDIQVMYFDMDQRRWLTIKTDTIDIDNQRITGLTTHFTDYIAGVIQAPESPETNSFTPTSISDIQVANPIANITQIEPPTANQKGDANVQFPIAVPAGRNGVQPSLAVSYNNNGSSGIAGYGWDISTPSISVDTRFGVPTFDSQKESETYLFNGEELLMKNNDNLYLSHREATLINRNTSTVQFYPKVEGSFSKIERSGSNPASYTWIVYDKSGMKYYYGTSNQSRLRTGGNTSNITKWMLEKVEDKDGNYMTYSYFTRTYSTGNLSGGKEILLSSILYTFNDDIYYGEDFLRLHRVAFNYDLTSNRQDPLINYRKGFKEVNASLLNNINVYSTSIRGKEKGEYEIFYNFIYREGQLKKLLLDKIETVNRRNFDDTGLQYDEESLFHSFDYYDDLSNGLFGEETVVEATNDIHHTYSLLDTTINEDLKTDSFSFGAGIFSTVVPSSIYMPSYSGSFNLSIPSAQTYESSPDISLIDIDGDGLSDIVVRIGDTFKYRKNLGNIFSPILLDIYNFEEISKTVISTSPKPQPSVSLFVASVGWSKSELRTESSIFLTDANSDGLIDFVKDKKVYFGKLETNSGLPTFTTNSLETPNVIYKGEDIDESILNPVPDFSLANDLMDVVKVWVAPKSGTINISGIISKQLVGIENGIRYSIEKSSNSINYLGGLKKIDDFGFVPSTELIASQVFNLTPISTIQTQLLNNTAYIKAPTLMLSNSQDTNFTNISVSKGDMIFFRVNNSQIPIELAEVTWNPSVTYINQDFDSPNGYKQYSSQYSDSFIYGNVSAEPIIIDSNGNYLLEWDAFSINNSGTNAELSDDVKVNVYLYKQQPNSTTEVGVLPSQTSPLLHTFTIKRNIQNNFGAGSISIPITHINFNDINNISENEAFAISYLKIELETKSQINWKNLDNKFVPRFRKIGEETQYVVPSYEVYKNQLTSYTNSKFTSSTSVRINHNFILNNCNNNDCSNQYIYLIAKNKNGKVPNLLNINGVLYPIKIRYTINEYGNIIDKKAFNPNLNTPDYTVNLTSTFSDITFSNTDVYFEYYTRDAVIATKLSNYQNTNKLIYYSNGTDALYTYNASNQVGLYRANIFYNFNLTGFGTLYRNWGQFAYKGAAPNENFTLIKRKYLGLNKLSGLTIENPTSEQVQSQENFFSTTDPSSLDYDFDSGNILLNDQVLNISPDQIEAIKHFLILKPNRDTNRWQATTKLFVGQNEVSPYLRFDNNASLSLLNIPAPYFSNEYGASSIIRSTYGSSEGLNTSVSYFGVSGGYSTSDSSSKIINDYRDVNGDGYPDILGQQVQLTSKRGGLSNNHWNYTTLFDSKSNGSGYLLGGSPTEIANHLMKVATNDRSAIVPIVGNASSGVSGSGFNTESDSDAILLDINGDGLVDKVFPNSQVILNNGNGFNEAIVYNGYGTINKSETKTKKNDTGVGIPVPSFFSGPSMANLGLARGWFSTENKTFQKSSFLDINGDGLVDYIGDQNVYINTGNYFSQSNLEMISPEERSNIQTGRINSATINVNIPIPLFLIGVKVGGGYNHSKSTTLNFERTRFMDFNGDGYLDIVHSPLDGNLRVRFSKIGRTNMLKNISNPTGSIITLDYSTRNEISNEEFGSTFKMPFKKWVLASVSIYDGYEGDGESYQKVAFEYKNGFKDRRERKFLGFGEVHTIQLRNDNSIYRKSIQEYYLNNLTEKNARSSSNYSGVRMHQYLSSLPTKSYTIDAIGRVLNESIIDYSFFDLNGNNPNSNFNTQNNQTVVNYGDKNRILPLVKSTKNIVYNYQGNSNTSLPYVTNALFMLYDSFGNVLRYKDVEQNLTANIEYHQTNNGTYIKNIPSLHTVSIGNEIVRKSTTTINQNDQISSISRHSLNGVNDISTTKLEYNYLGQLYWITYPKPTPSASESERFFQTYEYDHLYNTYLIRVDNSRSEYSSTDYTNFGMPTRSVDVNGNEFLYKYDPTRRLVEFKGPYHSDWTIQNEYNVNYTNRSYSITKHNLTDELDGGPTNILHTSVFVDGVGRTIQTKKQLDLRQVCPGSNSVTGYWFNVSGKTVYDEFGRARENYLDKEEQSCSGNFYSQLSTLSTLNYTDIDKTSIDYDILDRPILEHVYGLNASTQYSYGFQDNGLGSNNYFEKVILPEGNINVIFKDYKGRTTVSRQIDTSTNETLDTKFEYSPLNELLFVEDAEGYATKYTYDKFGQTTMVEHPDFGIKEMFYDLTGKLVKYVDANLLNNSESISYNYINNQLVEIIYPSHTVEYKYGTFDDLGNGNNTVGRLKSVNDLTGSRQFKYGLLGEIVEDKRRITTQNYNLEFITHTRYDSWGRVIDLTYPDGERLKYSYNSVGQLKSIENQNDEVYLKDVKYTYFGQPFEVTYGNDVKTTNHYDEMQRIRSMQLDRPSGNAFMHTKYSYDKNQNIVKMSNDISQHDFLQLGGVFNKYFEYDKFNRLKTATGEWSGYEENHTYSLEMSYNRTHGITKKNQKHLVQSSNYSGPSINNYNADYFYDNGNHPHAPNTIKYDDGSDLYLDYDANGNIYKINASSKLLDTSDREFLWDEQNRLLAVNDADRISHYVYDHIGERTFKSEGNISYANIAGQNIYQVEDIYNYLIYPSGFLVVDFSKKEYTKHYYSNGKKIASRIDDIDGHFEQTNGYLGREESNNNLSLPMTTFNINSCQDQINDILAQYDTPFWSDECRNFITSTIAQNQNNLCAILTVLNNYICEEAPSAPQPDPEDPTFPDDYLTELDCLNELNIIYTTYSEIMRSNSPIGIIRCTKDAVAYIDSNLTLAPSNACDVLEYIKIHYDCIEEDGYLDDIVIPDDKEDEYVHPDPETDKEDDEFDESLRKPIWWYHSDHLGSSSYLTDNFGRPTHYYDQLPFGESMVEHNQSQYYGNQYKFNGKELDAATGMYYYGARYYDPRLSIFVSVDPLAEQFMGWTPYHYVHQNPINLIDPTGMSAEGPPEGKYAQGHKHTDEQGVSWKLNGSVWENLSGGEDEWEPDTLNEIVIETDRSTDWKDVARTTAGFTPFLGSGLDIYEGIRDGNGWQVAGGIGGFILDVSTMGVGGVVIKGGAKALMKTSGMSTIKKGTKYWDEAVQNIRNNKKSDILTETATDAKDLLKEAKGNMNRYKNYTPKQYRKGYEMHNIKNKRELDVGNDKQHIKWKDGKSSGHIFFNKPN